jgi:5-methylcytosine-specific restriction endonuclease McrA
MTDSKTCSRCKQILPRTDFGKHSKTSDGLYSQCQPCRRQARAEYRKRNAENIARQQADNYKRNRSKRIAAASALVKAKPERQKIYNAKSKRNNRLAVAADTRRRNARRKANGVFAISKKELKRLSQRPCFYCGATERLTVDHVVAIARGGTDSIGNLVSACKTCNSAKRQLTIMEWLTRGNPPTVYAQSRGFRS